MEMQTRGVTIAMVALVVTLAAAPVRAEESSEPDRSVGLGLDLSVTRTTYVDPAHDGGLGGLGRHLSFARTNALSNRLRVPIRVDEHWYLEPAISGRYARGRETYLASSGSSSEENSQPTEEVATTRDLTLDLTLQLRRQWSVGEATRAHAGVEIGGGYWQSTVSPASESQADGQIGPATDADGMHLLGGPMLGAEHFIWPALSLGLEAKLLGHYHRADREGLSEPSTVVTVAPEASLVLRTYF